VIMFFFLLSIFSVSERMLAPLPNSLSLVRMHHCRSMADPF
jgi:hypothetical protein